MTAVIAWAWDTLWKHWTCVREKDQYMECRPWS